MVQVNHRVPRASRGSLRTGIGWRAAAAMAASLGVLASAANAAPVVSVAVPSAATVGASVVVAVQIKDSPALGAWQFDLVYDPALLNLNEVLEGDFLASKGLTLFSPGLELPGNVSGVSASWVDVTEAPSGSGTLAQFTFTTIAAGVAELALAGVFLNLLDSGFTVSAGSLCIGTPAECGTSVVATPGTLAVALLGVSLLRRRRVVSSKSSIATSGELS